MRTKILAGLVVLLAVVAVGLLLWRGYFGPPVVTVMNGSGALVREVLLEGNGFAQSLPDIMPGSSAATIVRPRGEGSLKITFLLNGQRVSSGDVTYLESGGGYRASVRIHEGGTVECRTDIGFSWRRAV